MSGLTTRAEDDLPNGKAAVENARQAWQRSMLRQIQTLKTTILEGAPRVLADRTGASFVQDSLQLVYWDRTLRITWPGLEILEAESGEAVATFDAAIMIYYLHTADGSPFADRWIGFRELPDGGFYHQAFQGYSGDLLAHELGETPQAFTNAAHALSGWPLTSLAPHAFAFQPLPRVRVAAALWPGDEDFPSKASILFDAAASSYMPTDGLALLGSGLVHRLLRTSRPSHG